MRTNSAAGDLASWDELGHGGANEVFHPGARQAGELMEAPQEQILPAPTPVDRLYDEHRLLIRRDEGAGPNG